MDLMDEEKQTWFLKKNIEVFVQFLRFINQSIKFV